MLINVKILPQIEESLIPLNCVRQPGCPSYLVAPFLWVGVFHFWDVEYLSGSQAPKMQFWMEKYFEVSQPKPLADDSPFHSSRVIVVQPNKYYNKIKPHCHKLITTASFNDTLVWQSVSHLDLDQLVCTILLASPCLHNMWWGWTFKYLLTTVHHIALDTDYSGGDEYYQIIVTTTGKLNYLFTVSVLNDTLLVYTISPPLWYTLHCQLMNHLQSWQRTAINALFHCMLCPHLCLLNLSVIQRH